MPRGARIALAALVAVILVWRMLVLGVNALRENGYPTTASMTNSSQDEDSPVTRLRKRLANNPSDAFALGQLAVQLQAQGQPEKALEAMSGALRLAPADEDTLLSAGDLFLSAGKDEAGLAILRRLVDLYPESGGEVWPKFLTALEKVEHQSFFTRLAQDNPSWWPTFFRFACENGTLAGVQPAFAARISAANTSVDERRCFLDRLQREDHWVLAYQFWIDSLPPNQRQWGGVVFNGGFELPLSNLGFDWRIPGQDGVSVTTEPAEAATGKRALHVTFVNKRYNGPPIFQYLKLIPGRYRFEGRGRADGLNTALGVQWGLYCRGAAGAEGDQLARSDALLGSSDWVDFQQSFVVRKECPVQVLRLELANPQRDAKIAGSAAIRLRGSVWYDDLAIKTVN